MRLVPDWREAWSWFSVQSLAILAALPIVWGMLPADLKAWVPAGWEPYILLAVALGGLAGRLIDQNKAPEA
jgi:ABC-type uncharacterized transport system permease subunit